MENSFAGATVCQNARQLKARAHSRVTLRTA